MVIIYKCFFLIWPLICHLNVQFVCLWWRIHGPKCSANSFIAMKVWKFQTEARGKNKWLAIRSSDDSLDGWVNWYKEMPGCSSWISIIIIKKKTSSSYPMRFVFFMKSMNNKLYFMSQPSATCILYIALPTRDGCHQF